MNSDWIQWILISEFIYLWIHIWIQNPYIWIHIHEFIYSWIHIFISYMNSYNDYMNSYVYEFIYMNSYMNSYKLWIHMIFSYMNSYVSWIPIWIRVYQGSRWRLDFSLSDPRQGHGPGWHWSLWPGLTSGDPRQGPARADTDSEGQGWQAQALRVTPN